MIFGTNYIMQNSLPEFIMNLYPFLYYFNYPIILLEAVGLSVMFVAYIPIYLKNKEKDKIPEKLV